MGLRLGQTLQLAALCAGKNFRPSETLPLQQSVSLSEEEGGKRKVCIKLQAV
jgi:hypothetical protein